MSSKHLVYIIKVFFLETKSKYCIKNFIVTNGDHSKKLIFYSKLANQNCFKSIFKLFYTQRAFCLTFETFNEITHCFTFTTLEKT